jgi:hypothetical protein
MNGNDGNATKGVATTGGTALGDQLQQGRDVAPALETFDQIALLTGMKMQTRRREMASIRDCYQPSCTCSAHYFRRWALGRLVVDSARPLMRGAHRLVDTAEDGGAGDGAGADGGEWWSLLLAWPKEAKEGPKVVRVATAARNMLTGNARRNEWKCTQPLVARPRVVERSNSQAVEIRPVLLCEPKHCGGRGTNEGAAMYP